MVEIDLAAQRRRQNNTVGCVLDRCGRVKHLKDTSPGGIRALDQVVDIDEIVDGAVEVAAIAPVGQQPAEGELTAQDKQDAATEHQDVAKVRHPANQGEDAVAQ